MELEREARKQIDAALVEAGWIVQDRREQNLYASRGVAIREFPMLEGYGFADYLLYVDQEAVGVVEAKAVGTTLTGFEGQAKRYALGMPPTLPAPVRPLPFNYVTTGVETRFFNLLDPRPKSRPIAHSTEVPHIHRPETLADWLAATPLRDFAPTSQVSEPRAAEPTRPSSLRGRLQTMPPLNNPDLWGRQPQAIENLERSLREDRPRALIQMATGSGKTRVAVSEACRLIRYGGAHRILFVVDRDNLGKQAETAFQAYDVPGDGRKFTELFGVQRLTGNKIAPSAKVVITTIQRLYSMLKDEPDLDAEAERGSQFGAGGAPVAAPLPVVYNAKIPPEFFDFVFIDECHRSIYTLWRQVIEYFDAFLVGLTATPATQTYAFFERNVVMEYPHAEAVADGVNVDFEVYEIRTKVSEHGATIEKTPDMVVKYRERKTRRERWETPDGDITYTGGDVDNDVVSVDRLRLIFETLRDRVVPELFPGRVELPKTIVFCRGDPHAEDVVGIARTVFGEGNDFAQKITYLSEGDSDALIRQFRTGYYPRMAVTVDMIATGTDIKPVEIVLFLRTVRSRVLFEQMKGRGVRVCDPEDMVVKSDKPVAKTHFVIVDCVGATHEDLIDTVPLDRDRSASMKSLLDHVASGGADPAVLSTLASRLARLDRQCEPTEKVAIARAAGGHDLAEITKAIVAALDPDAPAERARAAAGREPTPAEIAKVKTEMLREAAKPLAANPTLRGVLLDVKRSKDVLVDEHTLDELIAAGSSEEAKTRAKNLVRDFESFLAEHKDEIEALQVFYAQPHGRRLRYDEIRALHETLRAPPRNWDATRLWHAYRIVRPDSVRTPGPSSALADVVSLVRFALHRDEALVPHADRVRERFDAWMSVQRAAGRTFTVQQTWWLEKIRDHVAESVEIRAEDFDLAPFAEKGGLGAAAGVFGGELPALLRELNEALAA